jgi:hypothetical protein
MKNFKKNLFALVLCVLIVAGFAGSAKGQCSPSCPTLSFVTHNNVCSMPIDLATTCCATYSLSQGTIPAGNHTWSVGGCVQTDCGFCCIDGIIIDGINVNIASPGFVTQYWPNVAPTPYCNCTNGLKLTWDNTITPAVLTIDCY